MFVHRRTHGGHAADAVVERRLEVGTDDDVVAERRPDRHEVQPGRPAIVARTS